uniref:DUF5696 domain-containing protein n=1 Tax=Acetatifactor sp. TaxID=1872090 RepID=UPI0040577003
MCSKNKSKLTALLLAGSMLCGMVMPAIDAQAAYINTNRDTKLPEEAIEIVEQSIDEYEKLYETDSAIFYFRDDRDIIAVFDKESGYLWKTGLDSASAKALKKEAKNAETEEDFLRLENNPMEENMNEIYTDFANSLVTVEYRDVKSVESLKKSSSASEDSKSTLSKVSDNQFCLEVEFDGIDLQLKVYITFGEKDITYDIPFEEITGEGIASLTDLYITPFLGSSGGEVLHFNRETGEYDIPAKKDAPTGYAFIPDGSGALVRFQDNTVAFKEYTGDVYGRDVSQDEYYYKELSDAIALKDPVMPAFGVAYGDDQVAFVAYADEGDEHMSVMLTPEENVTYYTWTCPKFTYNLKYYKVYNKAGDGYYALMDEPNKFDISMTYEFLSGDGSGSTEAANYVGMALAYRNHLLEEGVLTESANTQTGDIPIRLDFIMSDAKSSVVGMENVVVTTADNVETILDDVTAKGITNINSGLYGWQKKGVSFARPYTQKFTSEIGTKKDFTNLFESFAEQGIDISFAQDYITINEEMVNYYRTAVKHVNSWYVYEDRSALLMDTVPISYFGFAVPTKSAEWLQKQFDKMKDYSSSMTIEGIGKILTGNHQNENEIYTVDEAVALYQETLGGMQEEVKLNIESPGEYLWQYTNRYLQAPVGHSQYIFETDAVPFLQIVLNGTMEVYAPYANFSFYTQSDILKMIDYNLYPSFILSHEPSYELADTVSCDLYSTEYSLYEDLITEVYTNINKVLSQVAGYRWANRTVVEDGVIVNTYEKDGEVKEVVINYSSDAVSYQGQNIDALSALVIE